MARQPVTDPVGASPMSQSPIGTELPRIPRGHELEAELGRGSVGVVLRAYDLGLARHHDLAHEAPDLGQERVDRLAVADHRVPFS